MSVTLSPLSIGPSLRSVCHIESTINWTIFGVKCQHCNAFFHHHQKVIDHVHANHPFCCYYCDTPCTEFDNIIKHSVTNHSLDVLKIKHLELNEQNGIYGYRSHNFNIIPRELDLTGKKIETDTTLDALKINIILDKSSDITTISSPLHETI